MSDRSSDVCSSDLANVYLFGRDPQTGFARRPLDNVGVQYGLEALRAGTIDMGAFLDLNDAIGGYDIDGQPVPERPSMSPGLAGLVYRVGGVIRSEEDPSELRSLMRTSYAVFCLEKPMRSYSP